METARASNIKFIILGALILIGIISFVFMSKKPKKAVKKNKARRKWWSSVRIVYLRQ